MRPISWNSLVLTIPAEIDQQRIMNLIGIEGFRQIMQIIIKRLSFGYENYKTDQRLRFSHSDGVSPDFYCETIIDGDRVIIKSIRLL